MHDMPTLGLNDGRAIPQLGLGFWQVPEADAAELVVTAAALGYHAIDTAFVYGNESGVGEGLHRLGGDQRPFVTTKLWNSDQGYDRAVRAFDASLGRLRLEAVDLYLIHWPAPDRGLFVESWKALVRLRNEGRARSIGVSNFSAAQIIEVAEATGVVPAVNQIELHPAFQQSELRRFHAGQGIVTQAWSPLGQARRLNEPVLQRLADKHRKSTAQIILRWHIDNGVSAIPKSVTPARLAQNIDIFDFTLDAEDRAEIAALDRPDGRIGPNPATFS